MIKFNHFIEKGTCFCLETESSKSKTSGSRSSSYFRTTSCSRNSANGIRAASKLNKTHINTSESSSSRLEKEIKSQILNEKKKKKEQSKELYVNRRQTKGYCETRRLERAWCGSQRECHPHRADYQRPISEQACCPLRNPRPPLSSYLWSWSSPPFFRVQSKKSYQNKNRIAMMSVWSLSKWH